ncbi:MAG: hypothetical protein NTY03_03695 [Candidatus Bathyarchaeota archaeon]|jgi:heterodisulfide reductase subunit B|nr:hypothetical protein [Candidatus Bathyarchaeota archaeon]
MAIKRYSFDGMVKTCPFCFKVYYNKQKAIQVTIGDRNLEIPFFCYTQLLGLVIGLGQEELGLELNQNLVDPVIERIGGM